jgi:hypothetical protein
LRGQLLDCKADGLGGTVKSPIPERLTAGLSIPGGKQLGLAAVVERTHRLILACGKGVDRPIIDLSPLDTRAALLFVITTARNISRNWPNASA